MSARGMTLTSAELYDPVTGSFSLAGSLTGPPRYAHTATRLNNGEVLIAGGRDGSKYLNAASLYEPSGMTPAGLVSISISPSAPTISLGQTESFVATGIFSDGSMKQLNSVVWSSSDPNVALVSNDAGNHGSAPSIASGKVTVTATAGVITASTTLIIDTN
jgi:uncharacterized protein YjdB